MRITREALLFLGIIILGLVLRLLFIDKPYGFWHNEMVMYNQAMADFPFGIIKASVHEDVHFPLYQILLGLWIRFFSNNDIIIRLFSVLIGTSTVIVAFFAGKEFKDAKLGNIFAFLTAINSTLIFYSQEVKFYGMLALLSALTLLFAARIKQRNNLPAYIGYVLSNIAIIYTFTIGIFYVFAEFIAFTSYLLLKNRGALKKFLYSHIALIVLMLPFLIYIFANFGKYEGASWIFTSNFFTTFVLIQNYFTPVLVAIYNNPIIYIPTFSIMPILFIYVPVYFAFYGIYKAIKVKKENIVFLLLVLVFFLCEIVLSLHSGLRVLTRYTILAIMPLLLLISLGFYYLKSWALKTIVIYLLVINIFFLIFSPISAVRGHRELGQKPVAYLLKKDNINNDDTIIIGLRKTDFNKYLDFKGRKFSMLQDFVYQDYAFDKSKSDKYESFRKYVFDKDYINKGYEIYFLKTVIKPMKKGSRIFLIWDENYNLYPFTKPADYRKYPIMTISLSKTNADTFKLCDKYLKYEKGYDLKYYNIFIFVKK